jgi:hypothetical protein
LTDSRNQTPEGRRFAWATQAVTCDLRVANLIELE